MKDNNSSNYNSLNWLSIKVGIIDLLLMGIKWIVDIITYGEIQNNGHFLPIAAIIFSVIIASIWRFPFNSKNKK